MEYTFENLNIASIILSRELLKNGIRRKTRGFDCIELPEPVLIHINNPLDRYINIKERKNHKVLPFAESLALASGINSMDLYASYVPSMMEYSDDGQYQRAGYGPRIRCFSGYGYDYKIDDIIDREIISGNPVVVDQLKFVIETLKKDLYSRQAIITIHDPGKDCFTKSGGLLVTKDQPCSRSLQFMVVNGMLDLTLYIRSNDLLYGFQAVNVFNFTFMLEYVANILKIPVGRYHHLANNLHFYEDKWQLVETMASKNVDDYVSVFDRWSYPYFILDLKHFDENIKDLVRVEKALREGKDTKFYGDKIKFFDDWYKVFVQYWKKEKQVFHNPYLNKLFS